MSIRDQMLELAYALTRKGIRPTADALTAELGGSKTTAVQALQVFWQDYLPPRLSEGDATADDAPPETIAALTKEVWRRAIDYADRQLEAKTASARAEAESEREAMAAERTALADEHERLSELAREAGAAAKAALLQRDDAEALRKTAALANSTLEDRLAAATSTNARSDREVDRLEQALRAFDAERAELVSQQATAMETLRASHEAILKDQRDNQDKTETHLRVELDAARTEAKQARQDATKAREGWDGKLEAERLRGERALAEDRGQATARMSAMRADLDAQIALLKQLVSNAEAATKDAAAKLTASTPEGDPKK